MKDKFSLSNMSSLERSAMEKLKGGRGQCTKFSCAGMKSYMNNGYAEQKSHEQSVKLC